MQYQDNNKQDNTETVSIQQNTLTKEDPFTRINGLLDFLKLRWATQATTNKATALLLQFKMRLNRAKKRAAKRKDLQQKIFIRKHNLLLEEDDLEQEKIKQEVEQQAIEHHKKFYLNL